MEKILDGQEFANILHEDVEIHYGRFTYPCRLKANPDAKYLSVQLHGALDRETKQLPVFARWNYGKILGAHVLAICDPTIYCDDTLRVGWYLGDCEEDITHGIVAIAEFCAKLLAIDLNHIVFTGSSGGGFASLQAAAHSKNGKAIVLNPQTNLIFRNDLVDYTRKVLGLTVEDAQNIFGIRWNIIDSLIHAFENGRNPKVAYVQNINDKSTYKSHFIPFANQFGLDLRNKSTINGNFMSILYEGNFKHEAEPPDVAKRMIHEGIPFLLAETTNCSSSPTDRVQNG